MDACLKAGQWKRSLELFREMSFLKLQKDAVSCNVAIMASSASSKWQHGLSVLTGRVADEISHTSCMNSCTERKQWRLALIYLGHLGQQNGLRLNSISCNSAVSACSCGDHWHLAWELFAWHGHIQNFYRCFYLQLSCFCLWPWMGIVVVHTKGCGGRRGCHECRHRYMRSRWLDRRDQTARGYATKNDPRRVRCAKWSEKWTSHTSNTNTSRNPSGGPSGNTSDLHSTGFLVRSCTLGSCGKFAGGDAKNQGWEGSLM